MEDCIANTECKNEQAPLEDPRIAAWRHLFETANAPGSNGSIGRMRVLLEMSEIEEKYGNPSEWDILPELFKNPPEIMLKIMIALYWEGCISAITEGKFAD